MNETISQRVRRYVLDGSNADLRRLLSIAELSADTVRTALSNTGVQPGWRVIDCGCGPIGGLAVMAELVGPGGDAVGIDFNDSTVERARSVAAALGLDNVEVHVGDVHELDAEQLGGPFDLAYLRCFLMHQPDPSRTLASIAALLRPGGWMVVHEPLRSPAPHSSPPNDALTRYWEILHDVAEHLGVPSRSIDELPRRAREAGLQVEVASGFFQIMPPELGFDLHAGTIAAAKSRATQTGLVTAEEIDALVRALHDAKDADYQWVSTPFYMALTIQTQPAGRTVPPRTR